MPEGRAFILALDFSPPEPYTIGQGLLFNADIVNQSIAADTFFVKLRDTTINQVLFRIEFLAPLLGTVHVSDVPFTVQGPAGIHNWTVEAGHIE